MGVVDGLLVNKGFIIESLLSFIEEERHRIIGAGLVKQESCDAFLGDFIKKLGSDAQNLTNDDIISKLTTLYDSMQNVRLYGDKFFEEEEKTTPQPVQEEVQSKVAEIDTQARDFAEKLEKIAYSLGSAGNHALAFEVEKVIKNLKGE